jgi:N-acetyl-alpha-D-glucosaminyl L-malate synthase BshA
VTAVSESLKADTMAGLGVQREISVIPNFLDCAAYRRRHDAALRAQYAGNGEAIVVHVSNFRPVKRVDVALEVFRGIRERMPARFLLIGDGPVREEIERLTVEHSLTRDVVLLGEQQDLVPWLSIADLFLLPSAQESFGLAALEAMACEVPVVASKVGGLPEIIEDGVTGYVCPLDDVGEMIARSIELLSDPERGALMGRTAAEMVRTRYCTDLIVPQYEAAYRGVLTAG